MLTTKLKNIADAIREKTGKTATMKLEDMPDEILSIQSGYSIEDILAGRIYSVESDWSGSVTTYRFHRYQNISYVNLPNATSVGTHAFSYCTSLISASLPSATGNTLQTFSNCTSLQYVDFRRITGSTTSSTSATLYNCFNSCKNLEYLAFQNLTNGFHQTSAAASLFGSSTILNQDLHVIFDMESVVYLGAAIGFASNSSNYSKIHIYVPTSQLSAYSSSKWNSFNIHTIEDSEDVLKGKYDWIDEKYFQN